MKFKVLVLAALFAAPGPTFAQTVLFDQINPPQTSTNGVSELICQSYTVPGGATLYPCRFLPPGEGSAWQLRMVFGPPQGAPLGAPP